MFKNEKVQMVLLSALGVTIGILLFVGGQALYTYGKEKMDAKATADAAAAAAAAATGTGAQARNLKVA
ncbi:MAG: hypothetical protein K9G46_07120 [Flavobacteriales bacterium]|nr:hypothetical protein [Flavobacteriales bacterium]